MCTRILARLQGKAKNYWIKISTFGSSFKITWSGLEQKTTLQLRPCAIGHFWARRCRWATYFRNEPWTEFYGGLRISSHMIYLKNIYLYMCNVIDFFFFLSITLNTTTDIFDSLISYRFKIRREVSFALRWLGGGHGMYRIFVFRLKRSV